MGQTPSLVTFSHSLYSIMLRLAVLLTLVAVSMASTTKLMYQFNTGEVTKVEHLQNECNNVGQLGSTCPLSQFPKAKDLEHCDKEESPPGFVFCLKTCCFDEGSKLPTCEGGLKFICT